MAGRVVHCRREPFDVYIGRPSIYGNPWAHRPTQLARHIVESRTEAIECYEKWLRSSPQWMAKVKRELRGKVLGCWCWPNPCHGDVLVKIANES